MRKAGFAVLVFATLVVSSLAGLSLAGQGISSALDLSPEERQWLDDNRNSIVLCYDAAFPPIEFRDEKGRFAGMGADIVSHIEALLGVTFVKKPTEDWNAFLKDLESGRVHLNAGMASTPERDVYAACTAPYIKLPLAIITSAKGFGGGPVDWRGLKGRRVAVVSGYMTESYVRRNSAGQFDVIAVGSVADGLRDVSFGVVDAFVDNLATASFYIERDALTNLRVAGDLDAVFPMSICVSRKYPLLLSALEKALARVPPEAVEASRKRWIPIADRGALSREAVRMLGLGGLFVGLLLVGLVGVSFFLKRSLKEKMRVLNAAQLELATQTERLNLAIDATGSGVWEYHPLTGEHYYSEQWYSMLGRKAGTLGTSLEGWKSLLHPEDCDAAVRAFEGYCASDGHGLYEAEFRLRCGDGDWRWVLGKGRAVAWDADGRPSRIIGLNMDIQKLKGVQEDLRRSEALVKGAFDQTFQLCALLDAQGAVVQLNRSATAFTGVSFEEVAGRPFWAARFWPDATEAENMLRRAMDVARAGGVARHEVSNYDRHGRVALIDFSLSPLLGDDGNVRFFIVEGRDVSDIRRAEAALKASEAKFKAIFNNAPVGIFRTTYSGRLLEANLRLAKIHGYASQSEMLAECKDVRAEIYANHKEREAFLAVLAAAPNGLRMELRLRRRNGEAFPAIINASLQHDAEGVPSFIDGVVEDITDRKRAEGALREKSALLEAQLNVSLDGILVLDEAGRRLLTNSRFMEMFHMPQRILDDPDGGSLLTGLAKLAKNPEGFLARVGELHATPEAVVRDEIEMADGRLVDRFSGPVSGDDGSRYGRIWTFRDITERVRLERRLADQLGFQQALLDTLPYAVFYKGPDTRFVGCNRAYEQAFGVQREHFIGKRVLDLEYLPLEDRLAFQAEDEATIASIGLVRREKPIPFQDGTLHQTLYSVSGFRQTDGSPGGLIGVIVDITDRKMAEERFSLIFEMAPECIFFVRTADLVLLDTNAAFEVISGYRREEAVGRDMPSLGLWDDLAERTEFYLHLDADGEVKNFEFMLRRKDGSLRRALNSSRTVTIAGQACYISIIHDITDERRMQELLIQSEKMMSVGSLAAGIAHEINNPLGIVHQAVQNHMQRTNPELKRNIEAAQAIGLDMDLLQQYLKARKLDLFLQDIQAAAMRASGIIRNMLNFSRRSESKRGVCDLHNIVEQAVFLASSDYDLKKSYDFKRIEIVLDLAKDVPACMCTETELEQVLLNLLRNSAQAMATAGSPDPRITIRLRSVEGAVRIEVADNGPGMSAEVQHKVFEPFFTTKPPGVGTGLGLSVSYFIVTRGHGGRMWVESAPGEGACFVLELPAKQDGGAHG